MTPFSLSGSTIDTLTTVANSSMSGNMANIAAMGTLIVAVVTIAFGRGLIFKGLRRIGF